MTMWATLGRWRRDAGLRAVLVAVALAYGLLSVRAIPLWDGAFYYFYLRSAAIDGDWNLGNDIRLLAERSGDPLFGALGMDQALTPTGRVRNPFPIGSALLWAPLYLLLHAGVWLLGGPARADGLSVPYIWLLSGMGAASLLLGMGLTYATCRRHFSTYAAALGSVVAWLASPLLHYALREPAYSHAASAFVVSLFVWLWWRDDRPWSAGRAALLGGVIGLAGLVRTQNLLFLLLPAGDLALEWRRGRRAEVWLYLGVMVMAALLVFSPQMATWQTFYGSPFTVPQNLDFREMKGAGFMQWLSPALGRTLFSSFHGLFTWQPAALLGVLGLALFWRRDRRRAGLALAGMALQIYVVASAGDWFGGEAFGPRRFDCLTPFLALGLAALASISRRRTWRVAAGVVGALLLAGNWILMMVAWPAGAGGQTSMSLNLVESGLPAFYRDWWRAAGVALRQSWRLVSRDAPLYRIVAGGAARRPAQIGIGLLAWPLPLIAGGLWLALGSGAAALARRRPALAAGAALAVVAALDILILVVL
jgi:hypothetical protein